MKWKHLTWQTVQTEGWLYSEAIIDMPGIHLTGSDCTAHIEIQESLDKLLPSHETGYRIYRSTLDMTWPARAFCPAGTLFRYDVMDIGWVSTATRSVSLSLGGVRWSSTCLLFWRSREAPGGRESVKSGRVFLLKSRGEPLPVVVRGGRWGGPSHYGTECTNVKDVV